MNNNTNKPVNKTKEVYLICNLSLNEYDYEEEELLSTPPYDLLLYDNDHMVIKGSINWKTLVFTASEIIRNNSNLNMEVGQDYVIQLKQMFKGWWMVDTTVGPKDAMGYVMGLCTEYAYTHAVQVVDCINTFKNKLNEMNQNDQRYIRENIY